MTALTELTLSQALAGLRAKTFSAVDLTRAYLDQIERLARRHEVLAGHRHAPAKIDGQPRGIENLARPVADRPRIEFDPRRKAIGDDGPVT